MTDLIPCRGLLFDADGVLVDSDASVEVSWTRWAYQWDLDPAVVLPLVHGRRSIETVGLLIDSAHQAQAVADADRFEVEDANAVTACPGAVELIGSLPPKSWAVVTSGRRPLATARLAAAGLPLPSVLVTADDVPRGKPDPAGYLYAAEALRLSPRECVVLEDSLPGVAAGLAARASVVGVSERAIASDAAIVVENLSGLRWTGASVEVAPAAVLRH